MRVAVVDAAATTDLRRAVLRPGRAPGTPLPGDDEPDAVHLALFDADGIVRAATLMLPRPYPMRPELTDAWQLRGMATEPACRGRGYGTRLVTRLMAEAEERAGALMWCNARVPVLGFYEALGFTAAGSEYIQEETGIPHRRMWQALPSRFRS